MSERLISFLFLGVLVALGYREGIELIYSHYFSGSVKFQTYWYLPLIAVPALLLFALAWWLGFFRKSGARVWDLLVLAVLAGLVVLTLPASYSCRLGCF